MLPPTPTDMVPVVAVVGTVTVRVLAVAAVTVAATPLNLTVSLAGVALKPEPTIVTVAPGAADVGLKLQD